VSFTKIALKEEIPEGTMKSVIIKGVSILIARVKGYFYAIENECTHAGVGLANGTLEGKIVTCPRAGSQFDITSGARLRGPAMRRVKTYKVKIEGRDVKVEI
jgi:nitrite reductase/ring-hydroxylating ferredoxin subunit